MVVTPRLIQVIGNRCARGYRAAVPTTHCRICEAACGLVAELGPQGDIVKLRPDRTHPVSRGYACAKGTRFHDTAEHPDRLLTPEVDGNETSWDAAIAHTASRLSAIIDEHGPHAVGVYFGNPMAFSTLGLIATLGFGKALGSRNIYYAGTQDCSNKFAAAQMIYGTPVTHPIADFEHAELAIVLGSNPYVSQSSFIHLEGGSQAVFGDLIARGGDVVWVDPRRNESATKWGQHLAIRPGADAWLLLALLQLVDDRSRPLRATIEGVAQARAAAAKIDLNEAAQRTGLGRDAIEALAARINATDRTTFHMSVGVNQGGFGTLSYVLLHALAYVTGNLDRRGGLVFNPTGPIFERAHRWARLENNHRSRIGDFPSLLGTLPGGILADEILEDGPGQIKAMLVLAGDPLRSIPGSTRLAKAFASLELLACVDMFRSHTARQANVVLPAASWLERWDIANSTVPYQQAPLIQVSGPIKPPPPNVRTDARILSDLALAMKLRGPWRLGQLPLDRWLPSPKYGFRAPRVRPGRGLSKRQTVRLWDAQLNDEVDRLRRQPGPADGWVLLCRRRRLGHNSWLHGAGRAGSAEAAAWMRSQDMAALGVVDGDMLELRTEQGALHIPVKTHNDLAPRTVVVPHGLPDIDINVLIPGGPEHVERLSGQLHMTGTAVSVSAAPACT